MFCVDAPVSDLTVLSTMLTSSSTSTPSAIHSLQTHLPENKNVTIYNYNRRAQWPGGGASDFKSRGPRFDPFSGRRSVSLNKTAEYWLLTRKQWLRVDIAQILLTGSLNQKQTKKERNGY